MPRYCNDKELRAWVLGKTECDGDSEKCGFLVRIGKQEYCGYCPPRCALHQIIRSQAGCLFCKYATRNLSCTRCADCLSADTRINYERDETEARKAKEGKR